MKPLQKKPFENQDYLDMRTFRMMYIHSIYNPFSDIVMDFSQRELRLIHKHLNGRNDQLSEKIKRLIDAVDEKDGRFTDWNARVPKTTKIKHR